MQVSVIIPTHDRATPVVRAVESVLAQSAPPFEVIVVDDGSTDDTGARLKQFVPRVRYERRPHRGVSAARNHGARLAIGRWLAFLDSDDQWLPDKMRIHTALHRDHPELSVSQTGEIWIRDGVRVNPCRHHAKPRGDIFAPSLQRCLVSPSAVMLRRDLFLAAGGFDEDLPVCEDYDLWLRLASRVAFGLADQELVVKHGGHADQLSSRYWGMDRFRVHSLAKLLAGGGLCAEHYRATARVLANKCTVLAKGARRRGRIDEADSYERLGARYAPVCR
jgi:glycosyltransferase involved in cell wall biosynthesis